MIKKKICFSFLVLGTLLFPTMGLGEDFGHTKDQQVQFSTEIEQKTNTKALLSTLNLEVSIKNRIKLREAQLDKEELETEQTRIQDEIDNLEKHFSEATADFERLATGVDSARFAEKRSDTFSWQEELVSLLKPALRELKTLTINAREKTSLHAEIAHHVDQQPIAKNALKQLQYQIAETDNPDLKHKLESLLPEWRNINEQLDSKLEVLRFELNNIEQRDKPFIDNLQDSTGHFFRNRGLYLACAITAFLLTLFCFSTARKLFQKHVTAFHPKNRSLFARLSDILFKLSGLIVASLSLFVVFYMVGDWTLLSLLVIFTIAILWSFRMMIPKFWMQGEILLNIGSVREGERLMFHGVPWLVRRINMYTSLENPDLDIQLRLPIEKLIGHYSREWTSDEPWFPCRKNDWLILSDGSFGKAISLSHEFVTLLERGGSRKTYQTSDFLNLAPRNLSTNFRVKAVFGISYKHQQQITEQLPQVLLSYLQEQFTVAGHADQLLDLQVSFLQAGASSLDLIVIADFKGTAAPFYKSMHSDIQRYCVEACTKNNWEIPFPQLTIHKSEVN
ncbi:MAG: hypothetical protein JKY62_06560 [Desulfocapsa sp.]|nr:hypothetical protein [Desulfocapsa sp.]